MDSLIGDKCRTLLLHHSAPINTCSFIPLNHTQFIPKKSPIKISLQTFHRTTTKIMATTGDVRQVEGSQNSLEIEELARFAVDDHNKKQNALLEFKKVTNVKQQVVAGTMHYITIEAADGGKSKVYEAKVWVKPWMNFKEVQEFKPVGDA